MELPEHLGKEVSQETWARPGRQATGAILDLLDDQVSVISVQLNFSYI